MFGLTVGGLIGGDRWIKLELLFTFQAFGKKYSFLGTLWVRGGLRQMDKFLRKLFRKGFK